MRGVAGVAVAAVFAALLFVAHGPAFAETDPDADHLPLTIAPDLSGDTSSNASPGVAANEMPAPPKARRDDGMGSWAFAGIDAAPPGAGRYLLFSNSDLWRNGAFTYGGVLWSPRGLDREGLAVKLIFGGGYYRYVSGALGNTEVTGRQLTAAILPGWRFVCDKLFVTVFAGPEFQDHSLSPDDPTAGLRGQYFGARAAFELWYEPTPLTMIAADGSISTIGLSYTARLAGGWKLFGLFYAGPELQAFTTDGNYQQYRAGIHVTGLRTGAYEWSAGMGWARDSDERSSVYGKLGMFVRR
jgi:hypothetical protein